MKLVVAAIAVLALSAAEAQARTPKPVLTATSGQRVQLRGRRLYRNMRVSFRWSRGALATRLRRSSAGWVARVPTGVPSGTIKLSVRDRAGRRSNELKLKIVRNVTAPI